CQPLGDCPAHYGDALVGAAVLRTQAQRKTEEPGVTAVPKPLNRCAIYTRKSSEEGLEQSFNSLDAQREACQAYILSQKQEGWRALDTHYDGGGYTGGNMERPALKKLLEDIALK